MLLNKLNQLKAARAKVASLEKLAAADAFRSLGLQRREALLPLGSAVAGFIAVIWFAERAFDLAVF